MSPEMAVAAEWRNMFTNPYVQQQLMLITIDEAHCIHEWLVSIVLDNEYNVVCNVIKCVHIYSLLICKPNLLFKLTKRRQCPLIAHLSLPFVGLRQGC